MNSETEPLWPYLFLAVGWSAVCAYLFIRARTGSKAPAAAAAVADSVPTSLSPSGHWERDTQAGRM